MAAHHSKNAEFWLALLELGDTEEEQRQNWNYYCYWKLALVIAQLVESDERQRIKERVSLPDDQMKAGVRRQLQDFVKQQGGHPTLPSDPSGEIRSFMDFSGREFPEDVSFAGRILIGVDFRDTEFKERADFSGAEFLGPTYFDNAEFHTTQLSMAEPAMQRASFAGSKFHGFASFCKTQFPLNARFNGAEFHQGAWFYRARFPGRFVRGDLNRAQVTFRSSQFHEMTSFKRVEFGADTEFDYAEMAGRTNFRGTRFHGSVRFYNCGFRSTTSFSGAVFWRPPEFFEAELHEDTDFRGADWTKAESSYQRSIGRDE
ncbi:MAG: hypothetical protein OXI87_00805 [Albidovulum sp.]|nr:hypothetical protein [Albidovulum sp.]